jgi:Fur family ferric uptake transcriptional regulator
MIRQTRQREAIEMVLKKESRPLTLPEIHQFAQQFVEGIGLRTIYRHIKDLSDQGRIVGMDYPGQPLRYELVGGHHHSHFICRKCSKVYDLQVQVPDIEIDAPDGFDISGQETIFYGICKACQ